MFIIHNVLNTNFKLGFVVSSNFSYIGLVKNQFISFFELKIKSPELLSKGVAKFIETKLDEQKIKFIDLEIINIFIEDTSDITANIYNELEKFAKDNKIKFQILTRADWIVESNWVYSKEQLVEEEIKDFKPQYPYLTVVSDFENLDIIYNNEKGDAKIVGSSLTISPEALIDYVSNFLGIKDENHFSELYLMGDPEFLDFKPIIKADFDINLDELKRKFEEKYSDEVDKIEKLELKVQKELLDNLKSDLLSSTGDKIFDYLITKILGIADAFETKNISLVGNLWNNRRFQEKIIREAIDDFTIKFPDMNSSFPLGSFLASYDL